MSLLAENVCCIVQGRKLLDGVSLRVAPGQVHALLGPNGAGKSTLLRLLARDMPPQGGQVTLDGKRLDEWSAQSLARRRAVLTQNESLRFPFTAEQVVALGRLPCVQQRPELEREFVLQALALTDARHLAARIYPTLSGGERQRVQLARALVQLWQAQAAEPCYLLLDEPTASLDLKHQHDALRVARDFARERGAGVLVVLHDPNLALAYASQVTVLSEGRIAAAGKPEETLTPKTLREVYGVEAELIDAAGRRQIVIRPS